jgi:precorrin-2 C(20)-methyltransferase
VGVGPGDPELVTVKAARLLARVPVVFYPEGGLARSIAAPYLNPGRQELHALPWRSAADWEVNGRRIAERIAEAGEAAFLVEGDPTLYSNFVPAARAAVRADPEIVVEYVPGIPALVAAAALLRRPLVRGDQRLALVTPGEGLGEALAAFDTVVVLKPSRGFDGVRRALRRAGREREAALVVRCGLPGQRVVTDLAGLPPGGPDYFSLLLVTRPDGAAGGTDA